MLRHPLLFFLVLGLSCTAFLPTSGSTLSSTSSNIIDSHAGVFMPRPGALCPLPLDTPRYAPVLRPDSIDLTGREHECPHSAALLSSPESLSSPNTTTLESSIVTDPMVAPNTNATSTIVTTTTTTTTGPASTTSVSTPALPSSHTQPTSTSVFRGLSRWFARPTAPSNIISAHTGEVLPTRIFAPSLVNRRRDILTTHVPRRPGFGWNPNAPFIPGLGMIEPTAHIAALNPESIITIHRQTDSGPESIEVTTQVTKNPLRFEATVDAKGAPLWAPQPQFVEPLMTKKFECEDITMLECIRKYPEMSRYASIVDRQTETNAMFRNLLQTTPLTRRAFLPNTPVLRSETPRTGNSPAPALNNVLSTGPVQLDGQTLFVPSNRAVDHADNVILNESGYAVTEQIIGSLLNYGLLYGAFNSTMVPFGTYAVLKTHMDDQDMVNLGHDRPQSLVVHRNPYSGDFQVMSGVFHAPATTSRVISSDIRCSNGYIHITDKVMTLPESSQMVLRSAGYLSAVSAITFTGFDLAFGIPMNTLVVARNNVIERMIGNVGAKINTPASEGSSGSERYASESNDARADDANSIASSTASATTPVPILVSRSWGPGTIFPADSHSGGRVASPTSVTRAAGDSRNSDSVSASTSSSSSSSSSSPSSPNRGRRSTRPPVSMVGAASMPSAPFMPSSSLSSPPAATLSPATASGPFLAESSSDPHGSASSASSALDEATNGASTRGAGFPVDMSERNTESGRSVATLLPESYLREEAREDVNISEGASEDMDTPSETSATSEFFDSATSSDRLPLPSATSSTTPSISSALGDEGRSIIPSTSGIQPMGGRVTSSYVTAPGPNGGAPVRYLAVNMNGTVRYFRTLRTNPEDTLAEGGETIVREDVSARVAVDADLEAESSPSNSSTLNNTISAEEESLITTLTPLTERNSSGRTIKDGQQKIRELIQRHFFPGLVLLPSMVQRKIPVYDSLGQRIQITEDVLRPGVYYIGGARILNAALSRSGIIYFVDDVIAVPRMEK